MSQASSTIKDSLLDVLELEKNDITKTTKSSKKGKTTNYDVDGAHSYFYDCTKKVYVERCNCYGIEKFWEYLSYRYRDNCYYYSFFALMGLKSEDYLVRGNIALYGGKSNYHHGWVEFRFKDYWYVFDSMIETVVPKEEWYKRYKPKIDYKITQRKILERWLNEKYAVNLGYGLWQFKYFVIEKDEDEVDYNEMIDFDRKNAHIPSALKFARIKVSKYDNSITRFIAYDEPSG